MHKEGTAMQFERNSLAALRRTSILIAILLAVPVVVSGTPAAATREKTLYQFQGGSDGWFPAASMIAGKNGNLYGATMEGGTTKHCEGQGAGGCGTIFQLAPPTRSGGMWTETVLYRFHGGKEDGAFPASPMIFDADGNLYGATSGGGLQQGCTSGCGTVFELSPPSTPGAGWTETILHLFKGVPSGRGDGDAADPNNVVLGSDGNIYGTAYSGGHCVTDETGTYCYGAVFELKRPANPNGVWTEKLLSIFRGPTGAPQGAILDKTGNLYGTAVWGAYGFGEVFQLVPAAHGFWTRNNIYSFHDAPDGAFPVNGLPWIPPETYTVPPWAAAMECLASELCSSCSRPRIREARGPNQCSTPSALALTATPPQRVRFSMARSISTEPPTAVECTILERSSN
jgi:uncharacterized repeat protein (TIGR03803 family)